MKISFDVINWYKMGKTYYPWAHELLRQELVVLRSYHLFLHSMIEELRIKLGLKCVKNILFGIDHIFSAYPFIYIRHLYSSIYRTYTTLAIFSINIIIDALNINVKSNVVVWPHIWVLCPAKYLSRCRTSSSVYCPRPNFCEPYFAFSVVNRLCYESRYKVLHFNTNSFVLKSYLKIYQWLCHHNCALIG